MKRKSLRSNIRKEGAVNKEPMINTVQPHADRRYPHTLFPFWLCFVSLDVTGLLQCTRGVRICMEAGWQHQAEHCLGMRAATRLLRAEASAAGSTSV